MRNDYTQHVMYTRASLIPTAHGCQCHRQVLRRQTFWVENTDRLAIIDSVLHVLCEYDNDMIIYRRRRRSLRCLHRSRCVPCTGTFHNRTPPSKRCADRTESSTRPPSSSVLDTFRWRLLGGAHHHGRGGPSAARWVERRARGT